MTKAEIETLLLQYVNKIIDENNPTLIKYESKYKRRYKTTAYNKRNGIWYRGLNPVYGPLDMQAFDSESINPE